MLVALAIITVYLSKVLITGKRAHVGMSSTASVPRQEVIFKCRTWHRSREADRYTFSDSASACMCRRGPCTNAAKFRPQQTAHAPAQPTSEGLRSVVPGGPGIYWQLHRGLLQIASRYFAWASLAWRGEKEHREHSARDTQAHTHHSPARQPSAASGGSARTHAAYNAPQTRSAARAGKMLAVAGACLAGSGKTCSCSGRCKILSRGSIRSTASNTDSSCSCTASSCSGRAAA